MAVSWTTIPNTDVDAESPIDVDLMTALRDNPEAMAQGATGAPDFVGTTGASLKLLTATTAAASASVDFTDLDGTYDEYVITISTAIPATDSDAFYMRVSTDNGSTWITTSYRYTQQRFNTDGGRTFSASASTSVIGLVDDVGNGTGESVSGIIRVTNVASTSLYKHVCGELTRMNSTGLYSRITLGGLQPTASAVDAIQFYFSVGNITSGEFRLYGIRKA